MGLNKSWITFYQNCDRIYSCIRKKRIQIYCLLQPGYSRWNRENQNNHILFHNVPKLFFLSCLSLHLFPPSTFSVFSHPSFLYFSFSLIFATTIGQVMWLSYCEFNSEQVRQGCCSYRIYSLLRRIKKKTCIIQAMIGAWRVLWEHLGVVSHTGIERSREVALNLQASWRRAQPCW